MEYKRWAGKHDWKTANETMNDSIDGDLSFNERCHTETQNLDDLIRWLEYANTGYPATRQTVDQEEYWARLLRNLLCEKLIKNLAFFNNNTFECKCKSCNLKFNGTITTDGKNIEIDKTPCIHIKNRFLDIIQYILSEFEEWQ